MRIAFDLDNTIICYDGAFASAGVERGFLPPDAIGMPKEAVKHQLHAEGPSGVQRWQALQGYVYGRGINNAGIFDGVADCLQALIVAGNELYIVSHKTLYGHFDETKTNLRDAARGFLRDAGINALIPASSTYFCDDLPSKIAKITTLQCDIFVDDLVDVLFHIDFPPATKRVLFRSKADVPCDYAASWNDLQRILFRLSAQ